MVTAQSMLLDSQIKVRMVRNNGLGGCKMSYHNILQNPALYSVLPNASTGTHPKT